MTRRSIGFATSIFCLTITPALAQWSNVRTRGIPRTGEGRRSFAFGTSIFCATVAPAMAEWSKCPDARYSENRRGQSRYERNCATNIAR